MVQSRLRNRDDSHPLGTAASPARWPVSGELLNIKDVYKDSRFNPDIDKKTGYRTRSVLAAPMFNAKDQVIGVFQVLTTTTATPSTKQDEEILTLIADQASGHVENAQLYQEIRKATQETIIRLAAAVEFKDHDTRAHLWRMSQYFGDHRARNGLRPGMGARILRLAAPMHDIGKIGVPDAILNKPGKLTDEEWVEMKKHPIYGSEILKTPKTNSCRCPPPSRCATTKNGTVPVIRAG